ncbi:FUSC family protein [Agrobacterium vitis]
MSAVSISSPTESGGASAALPHTSGPSAADKRGAVPPQRPFAFAMRTTFAALLALGSSELLGIHHPWWAAMTVWLVAQPTRGLLLERSLARLIGTVCGAIAGALILTFLAQNLPIALTALALWLALCAGAGSVFRHFRNYGFVLAGYTAGIVVLFGLGDGHADSVLAQDRVLCTLIGIVCSGLFSFHALPSKGRGIKAQARSLLDRVLRRFEGGPAGQGSNSDPSLVAAIGAFDRAIDEQAAGSLRDRADILRLRHISGILLELIALARVQHPSLTAAVETRDDPLPCVQSLAANAASGGHSALARTLGDLAQALDPDRQTPWRHFRFDFDAVIAVRAAARPVLALVIAATLWLATGWQVGAMMAMTAVLFTSLFSSHDHGNQIVVQVLIGTITGAAAGLLARLFLLPHADGLLATLVCVTPFLLTAAWLMRWPSTAKMAIDMAMTFLLTAQPGTVPVAVEVAMAEAAAIVTGVLIAVAMFWLIFPSTPDIRARLLAGRLVRLTGLIGRNRHRSISASHYEALRSTQVRLLDVTEADSALFEVAQTCVAAASEARNLNSTSAREAALDTAAALDALITSNTRRK